MGRNADFNNAVQAPPQHPDHDANVKRDFQTTMRTSGSIARGETPGIPGGKTMTNAAVKAIKSLKRSN